MTTTTLIILNMLLAVIAVGGLAAIVRLAHRLPESTGPETLHPSQPIPLRLAAGEEERDLARAA